MFQTFKNAWKVPDLKKKILFTLMILLLYRIGASLCVPYVNINAFDSQASLLNNSQGLFAMYRGCIVL